MKMKYVLILFAFLILSAIFMFDINHKNKLNFKTDLKRINADNSIYYGSEYIDLAELNDPLFSESEYSYNHKLACKSLNLAVSTFSSNVSSKTWGEDADVGRADNVFRFLKNHGFKNIKPYDYDVSLNDTSSKAAFVLAKKEYNHNTDIVVVAIRGGNYGLEWVDNFNIGSSSHDYHRGFYESATKIKRDVDNYINNISKAKNVKLWITGYSRGGAIANILASIFDNEKQSHMYQVYAYTFASPKSSVIESTSAHDTIYRNIFNIISPNDPVYNIPPDKWGFGRFGICVVFPDNNDLSYEGASDLNQKVASSYYSYTGKPMSVQHENVNSFINILIKSAESRDFFSSYLAKPIADFLTIKMSKEKNSNGIWQPYSQEKILKKMYGEKANAEIKKIKENDFFSSLKRIGVSLPDDFYLFITLCQINGFSKYEQFLFSNLKAEDIGNVSAISSNNITYTGHENEFYKAWIENVSVSSLKFVKA